MHSHGGNNTVLLHLPYIFKLEVNYTISLVETATSLHFDHPMLIKAHLKRMTAGCYHAQSPRIHLQCWHLKHLMFILWRRWDNPLRERHKHSTLGAWLLPPSSVQPTWLQGLIQDSSSPEMKHGEKRRQKEVRPEDCCSTEVYFLL